MVRSWQHRVGRHTGTLQILELCYTYGMKNMNITCHALYHTWATMKHRCYNDVPSNKNYAHYGGRGIRVCDRWLESFWHFVEDMGERPKGTTLNRIDNDGNYEPDNCEWATHIEQAHNKTVTYYKPLSRKITINGVSKYFIDWVRQSDVKVSTAYMRYSQYGWSAEEALGLKERKRKAK